jgi:hypothetical protein
VIFWFILKMLALLAAIFACCILLAILLLYLDRELLLRKVMHRRRAIVSKYDAGCARSFIGKRKIIADKDRYPKLKLKPPVEEESQDTYSQTMTW